MLFSLFICSIFACDVKVTDFATAALTLNHSLTQAVIMIRTLGKNGGNIIMKKTRVKKRDGSILNLCFFGVPKDRIDDLVEFQMNNYVSYELTYRISGKYLLIFGFIFTVD